jgi:hypothetical protein
VEVLTILTTNEARLGRAAEWGTVPDTIRDGDLDRLTAKVTQAAQELSRFSAALAGGAAVPANEAAHCLHRARLALAEARAALIP